MQTTNSIRLNFLEVRQKVFDVKFFYKKLEELPLEEQTVYYRKNLKLNCNNTKYETYAITFNETLGFKEKVVSNQFNIDITKQFLFALLHKTLTGQNLVFQVNKSIKYHRLFLPIRSHVEGLELIWLEPHYLEAKKSYGFLIDYKFSVDVDYQTTINGFVNKKILQLSGTLDNKGYSNRAFYQFKFGKLNEFFTIWFSKIKNLKSGNNILELSPDFTELDSYSLNSKIYQFHENKESNSSYIGLKSNSPFKVPERETDFIFIFKSTDRVYAINLLNGLKGITYQSTFPGIETMFKIPFNNQNITGKKVDDLTDGVFLEVVNEIKEKRLLGRNILPIILTNSHGSDVDDKLYFTIKHTFTKENIPCQVVTKDLVIDSGALKYSLSNIGLQIFAKSGGMPWKIKPAIKQCVIIGIGTKNKEVFYNDELGSSIKKIEKFLTYSVLTDHLVTIYPVNNVPGAWIKFFISGEYRNRFTAKDKFFQRLIMLIIVLSNCYKR